MKSWLSQQPWRFRQIPCGSIDINTSARLALKLRFCNACGKNESRFTNNFFKKFILVFGNKIQKNKIFFFSFSIHVMWNLIRFPFLFSKILPDLSLLSYVVFYVLKAGFADEQVMPATGVLVYLFIYMTITIFFNTLLLVYLRICLIIWVMADSLSFNLTFCSSKEP